MQLESCHNLIAQTKPKEDNDCNSEDAMLTVRLVNDLSTKITKEGTSFAQQECPLNKGIKVFGQKGQDASITRKWIKRGLTLLHPGVCRQHASNQREKGAGSTDVSGRKAMRNRQSKNGWFAMESQQAESGCQEKTHQVQQQHSKVSSSQE
jgi:hypothetical protein